MLAIYVIHKLLKNQIYLSILNQFIVPSCLLTNIIWMDKGKGMLRIEVIFTTLFDDLRTTNHISHFNKLIFHIFAIKIIDPFDIRAFK